MRRLLIVVGAAVPMAVIGVPALAATTSVKVGDNYYVRDGTAPTVTVKRNDVVRWRFVGRTAHTVTVRKGPQKFGSSVKVSGVYQRRMTRAGTYRIYCTIHGAKDQSMILRVR